MDNFTQEEIDRYINMGRALAEKIVYDFLILHHSDNTGMIAELNRSRKYKDNCHLSIDLDDLSPGYKLILQAELVQPTYKFAIKIHRDYTNAMIQQANLIFTAIKSMYDETCKKYNITTPLVFDKQLNSFYTDKNNKRYISILAYYVDNRGNPLRETTTAQ